MVRMVTNRWKPDTCDCIIEYEFDADLDESSRVHTGNNIVQDCPEHSGLSGAVQFYDVILNENQRKNFTRHDLLENISELGELDEQGHIDFKKGITFGFYWTGADDARVLHITITGYTLTAQQKTQAQNFADAKFGSGKVVID